MCIGTRILKVKKAIDICECGSKLYILCKNRKIRCAFCGDRMPIKWFSASHTETDDE